MYVEEKLNMMSDSFLIDCPGRTLRNNNMKACNKHKFVLLTELYRVEQKPHEPGANRKEVGHK